MEYGWDYQELSSGYEKMTYLEPFAGSLAVLFNKNRSEIETINDLDGKNKTNCKMGKAATEVIWMNYEPPQQQLNLFE